MRTLRATMPWPGLARMPAALLVAALLACSGRDTDFGGNGPGIKVDPNDPWLNSQIRPLNPALPFDTLRAATFNMSIGFPVTQLLFVNMTDPAVAYDNLDTILARYQRGKPRERIKAMAQAIVREDLQVVGLQEVMKIAKDADPPDDFLAMLLQEINALGGPAYQSHKFLLNDTILSGVSGARSLTVHFSEGNALLVAPGFQVAAKANILYKTLLPIPVPGKPKSQRGLNYVRIGSPKGIAYQVYNTHLEVDAAYRNGQALELQKLQDSLKLGGSVQIVLGDFNADPPRDAYNIMIEGGWLDTFAGKSVGDTGTCCVESSRLWDVHAAFSARRIDLVLAKRIGGVMDSRVILGEPRATAEGDSVMPSDHRMVVARLLAQ